MLIVNPAQAGRAFQLRSWSYIKPCKTGLTSSAVVERFRLRGNDKI